MIIKECEDLPNLVQRRDHAIISVSPAFEIGTMPFRASKE
jgi:hypothetical protein